MGTIMAKLLSEKALHIFAHGVSGVDVHVFYRPNP